MDKGGVESGIGECAVDGAAVIVNWISSCSRLQGETNDVPIDPSESIPKRIHVPIAGDKQDEDTGYQWDGMG